MSDIREDGMPVSSTERHLRRMLAAAHNLPGTYYDDGEAHAYSLGGYIDFMRDPPSSIANKLRDHYAKVAEEKSKETKV